MLLKCLFIFMTILVVGEARKHILLSSISGLTLFRGIYTEGNKPIPQLESTDGTAFAMLNFEKIVSVLVIALIIYLTYLMFTSSSGSNTSRGSGGGSGSWWGLGTTNQNTYYNEGPSSSSGSGPGFFSVFGLSKNPFAPLFDMLQTSKRTNKNTKSKKNGAEKDDTSVFEDVSLNKSNSKNELTLATKLEKAIHKLDLLVVEDRELKKLKNIQYFSSFPNELKNKLRQIFNQNKDCLQILSVLNQAYADFWELENKRDQKRYTLNELFDAATFYLNKGETIKGSEMAWSYYNCFISRYYSELGDQYKIDIKSHDATDLLASLMIICYGNSVGDTEKVIYLNGARESANCSNRAFYTASSNDEVFERLKEIKMFVETLKTLDKSLVINRISACENNGGIFNFIGKTCRIINEQHRGGIFGYQYCFTHTAC